jgi:hypothetical protein
MIMSFKSQLPPMLVRKPDSRVNPNNTSLVLEELKKRDQGKLPVRKDSRTVIFVSPDNTRYRQL